MMTLRVAVAAVALCGALPVSAVDLWGVVKWKTGAPVAGVELRLALRGRVLPTGILTNSAGRYGLYNLSTPTSDYSLQLVRGGSVVKTVRVPPLKAGGRIPDIIMP